MADTVLTKKITDLPEGTEINDEDLVMTGVNGTASLRKNKWSKFVEKLRNVLFANNLTTTQAGYGLDARQGKALKDEIDKINTKIKYVTYRLSGTENAAANTWNYISDVGYRAPEGYKIVSVCGGGQAWPYASVNAVVMSSGAIFVWYYKANTNSNNLNNIVLYITLEKTD